MIMQPQDLGDGGQFKASQEWLKVSLDNREIPSQTKLKEKKQD